MKMLCRFIGHRWLDWKLIRCTQQRSCRRCGQNQYGNTFHDLDQERYAYYREGFCEVQFWCRECGAYVQPFGMRHNWEAPAGPDDLALLSRCGRCKKAAQFYLSGRPIEPGEKLSALIGNDWHHVSFGYSKEGLLSDWLATLFLDGTLEECGSCYGTGSAYSSIGLPDHTCDSCEGSGTQTAGRPLSYATRLRWPLERDI
jgi:hypothetical protein